MASPAPPDSTEARELALVDKVELRIALADSDAKLENLLKVYLAPLLLKLGSEHLSVRNKRLADHCASRSVKLPVAPLLQQLKDAAQPALVRHFDLLYIQQGLDRLSAEERGDLFKVIVPDIASSAHYSAAHASGLFNLLLRLLADFRIPGRGSKEDDGLREALSLQQQDAAYLSHWFSKLLLFRPRSTSSPGLSGEEQAFLSLQDKAEVWDPAATTGLNITNTKTLVLRLIGSGMFHDDERLFPALFASADQNSRLADPADEILKRVVANISLDDSSVVQKLYGFYFGTLSTAGQPSSNAVMPANLFLRIKILGLLSKTTASLQDADKIVSIVERDLLENTAHALDDSKVDRAAEKLRAAIITFLTHAVHNADKKQMQVISEAVIPKLQQFIDGYVQDNMSLEAKGVRGRSFEVVGLLASANQTLMADTSLSFTKWLFDCLAQEADRDVLVSVDEAVSTILRPLQLKDNIRDHTALQELLLKNMSLSCRNRRNVVYATLRFANRCLPFSNVTGRLIDLIALGEPSNSHEIVDEASKGLDPYWHEMTGGEQQATEEPTQRFPNLIELVKALDLGNNSHASGQSSYRGVSLGFCREALLWTSLERAKIKVDIAADWKRKLDLAVAEDADARAAVRMFLTEAVEEAEGREMLDTLWHCTLQSMQSDNANERSSTARFAYELCALGPHKLLTSFLPTLSVLAKIAVINDMEVRSLAAQAFGLLASLPTKTDTADKETLDSILSNLTRTAENWRSAVGSGLNQSHGATISLCYLSSRKCLRHGTSSATESRLGLVLDMLEHSTDLTLQDAALVGLGQLCLSRAATVQDIDSKIAIGKLVELLTKKAKTGNEKAIHCFGNLSLILDETSDKDKLKQVLDGMHELHEIRQPETQFAVGEALSTALVGWESKTLLSRYDIEGAAPTGPERAETCSSLIERVLQDCSTTKPSLKKAAVIWLLCFIQYAGGRPEIKSRLQQLQTAFKRCLSDRDELVQESASRGLGLVYELGDRSLKDDLVRDLIGSFSSNKANMSGTVTEDTQLFEPGALPTGDGSITTYKDIMSLASEVGDSSLVYRFMSLASNNAIWSSRAAFGRFGLSNVLSDSSIDGYLAANPKLYPKLYRYRFDANSNVRRSMNDIWSALVKDSNATIEANFEAIMEDLLSNIVSGRDWRARQASCAAMSDLVQGRSLERVEPYLERIWTMCFKVIDDIKDSVRKAAAELARVLSALLIRTLEASQGASASAGQVLSKVLPFLLSTSGLESSAEDVRALSLHTLLEIIKKAKAQTLRPFLAELIEKLLGLLSIFEPESINYISLNASKYNLKEQDIDDARLRGVRSSPLMEALERCLDQLDEETVATTVQVLKEVIKSAVGLPTKVGVCRVVVSLCTRRALLVRPHADELLAAMQKRVVDRNDTVSSSYAAAMGYLARGATDAQILAMVALAKQLFFESEEERRQIVSGEMMHGLGKHAGDRFAALAAEILPFVFVARQHDEERVNERFREVWEDNVGGARAASLYLSEIAALVQEQLGSRRWGVKHAAARAIADASKTIAATQGSVSAADGAVIWPALRTALAEKSWPGKEKVLEGFVTLAERGDDFWRTHAEEAAEVTKIALREARRRNVEYQEHAIGALAKVVAHWGALVESDKGERLFEAVVDISSAAIDQSSQDPDAMDVDEGAGSGKQSSIAAAIEALTSALAAGQVSGEHDVLDKRFSRILTLLLKATTQNAAPVSLAVFDCCARCLDLLNKSRPDSQVEEEKQVEPLKQLLFGQRDSILTEPVRQRRADAILSLSRTPMHATQRAELVRLVQSAHAQERSTAVRATLAKCL